MARAGAGFRTPPASAPTLSRAGLQVTAEADSVLMSPQSESMRTATCLVAAKQQRAGLLASSATSPGTAVKDVVPHC